MKSQKKCIGSVGMTVLVAGMIFALSQSASLFGSSRLARAAGKATEQAARALSTQALPAGITTGGAPSNAPEPSGETTSVRTSPAAPYGSAGSSTATSESEVYTAPQYLSQELPGPGVTPWGRPKLRQSAWNWFKSLTPEVQLQFLESEHKDDVLLQDQVIENVPLVDVSALTSQVQEKLWATGKNIQRSQIGLDELRQTVREENRQEAANKAEENRQKIREEQEAKKAKLVQQRQAAEDLQRIEDLLKKPTEQQERAAQAESQRVESERLAAEKAATQARETEAKRFADEEQAARTQAGQQEQERIKAEQKSEAERLRKEQQERQEREERERKGQEEAEKKRASDEQAEAKKILNIQLKQKIKETEEEKKRRAEEQEQAEQEKTARQQEAREREEKERIETEKAYQSIELIEQEGRHQRMDREQQELKLQAEAAQLQADLFEQSKQTKQAGGSLVSGYLPESGQLSWPEDGPAKPKDYRLVLGAKGRRDVLPSAQVVKTPVSKESATVTVEQTRTKEQEEQARQEHLAAQQQHYQVSKEIEPFLRGPSTEQEAAQGAERVTQAKTQEPEQVGLVERRLRPSAITPPVQPPTLPTRPLARYQQGYAGVHPRPRVSTPTLKRLPESAEEETAEAEREATEAKRIADAEELKRKGELVAQEEQRLAVEKAAQEQQAKIAREEQERIEREQERIETEKRATQERIRLETERVQQQQQQEQERARQQEIQRQAAERAEAERIQAERVAAQKEAQRLEQERLEARRLNAERLAEQQAQADLLSEKARVEEETQRGQAQLKQEQLEREQKVKKAAVDVMGVIQQNYANAGAVVRGKSKVATFIELPALDTSSLGSQELLEFESLRSQYNALGKVGNVTDRLKRMKDTGGKLQSLWTKIVGQPYMVQILSKKVPVG